MFSFVYLFSDLKVTLSVVVVFFVFVCGAFSYVYTFDDQYVVI